jgi:hypothetical protein
LNDLDILEEMVPVKMSIDDNQPGSRGSILEESDNGNVVFGHDAIVNI